MPLYNPASAAVTDATIATTDVTTNNSSTSKHGWLKKLDNTVTNYMDGTGGWSVPAGGSADLAGKELDYATKTSNTSITATSAGTADTIITGASVAYNGSTVVEIQFGSAFTTPAVTGDITIGIFESTTEVGRLCYSNTITYVPMYMSYRLTPSNASHTYLIKAWVSTGTGTVGAGAGGAAAVPAFMRIIRVTS